MTSHSGRVFLNSCLKVPIDPCNNCPAPVYNRSRMFFGRYSISPVTTPFAFQNQCKNGDNLKKDINSDCIRSLARFYDSIPEYSELNHLNEEEFYSTLDTLRRTCRKFKIATMVKAACLEERASTTNSNSTVSSKPHKSRKSRKKKKSFNKTFDLKSKTEECEDDLLQRCSDLKIEDASNGKESSRLYRKFKIVIKLNFQNFFSLKTEIQEEVEKFKKSLQDFENEFTRPGSPFCDGKGKTGLTSTNTSIKKIVPVKSTFTSSLRERLQKSFSFNDLHSLHESRARASAQLEERNKTLEQSCYKDKKKLSNYFEEKGKRKDKTQTTPIIIVDSASSSPNSNRNADKKTKKRLKSDNFHVPFKVFNLIGNTKKPNNLALSTPSPLHPPARPNLAATLRVEHVKKKVKELKNNCTYQNTTSQFDWEVRKTPAWKSLSLNEPHKDILAVRLATRKAEQALQRREYELNMEIMRQRVKSAPLLLEGQTYWGPHVGKLSHTCQKEGRRHLCSSNQQRKHSKKNSSRSQSCRRNLFHNSSVEPCLETSSPHPRQITENRSLQKFDTLRKIYGGLRKRGCSTKSQTNSSNRSGSTQRSALNRHKASKKATEVQNLPVDNDSNDDLSSLDRAFL
ncbi:LOW QUALITY PROTEIN: uncharacterized protein ACN2A1_007103 [Glossina fuscipes fuscipes]